MSKPLVMGLPGNESLAAQLAVHRNWDLGILESRRFPDGESYVRLASSVFGRSVALVCTLNDPDPKFLRLCFTAAAAHDQGATRIGLISPYLAYMRQDKVFHEGEGITSDYFARIVSSQFDWLVTLDPHLHRHHSLSEIYTIPALSAHSTAALADWISGNIRKPILIGPDSESEQWVRDVAMRIDAPYRVLEKARRGDRDVSVSVPDMADFLDRTPVLIDDIVSSGRTMIAAATQIRAKGFDRIDCVAVHALFAGAAYAELKMMFNLIVTTNAVPHESNRIDVSTLLGDLAAQLV